MTTDRKTREQLQCEITDLRAQLAEAQETLRAIHRGEVDALVVETPEGDRIYTLQGAEQDYRLLVEQMHEGAASLAPDGRISYANQCFADMLRQPLEQVIGSPMQDHLAESSRNCLRSLLSRSHRDSIRGEMLLKASDGTNIPAQLSLSPQRNGALAWYLVVTDLSERRRTEQTLANEQFIRRLIDNAPTGVAVVGRDLRYSLANPTYQAIAGDPDISLVGRTIAEAFPPSVAQIVQPLVQQTLDTGQPLSFHEYEAPVRGRTWWNVRQIPLKDAAGQTEAVLIIADEVTEQVQARAAMQESEERLRLLGDNLPDIAVYQYVRGGEAPGRFTHISAGIERLNGIKVSDALRDAGTLHRQILPEYLERLMQEELRCIRTLSDFDMDVPMRRPDGEVRWMRLHSRPRRLPDGEIAWDGVQIDITERRRAEGALRESETKFRGLFDGQNEAIQLCELVFDEAGRPIDNIILDVNPAYERHSGLSRSQVVGRRIREILPVVEQAWLDRYGELVRVGKPLDFEEYNTSLDRWFEVHASPMQGNRFVAVFSDITQRKRAEEAAAAARRQVQSIIDNTTAIIYAFDLEERFLIANAAIAKLLNSTPEQMIGRRRHEFMPKEDADWHEANDRQAIEAGRALEFEEYSQLKGRSITWLTTKFPLRDAQGRIYAVAGISTDVSERKRAEEARAALAAIVESSEDAIISKNLDGTITSWNVGAEHLFGYRADEIIGQPITRIVPPDLQAEEATILDRLRRGHAIAHYETVRLASDGRRVPVSLTISPLRDASGSIIGASNISRDITERKRAEQQLKDLNETLEKRVAERTAVAEVRAEQLRMLAQELTQAEQRERQRIAHILHEHFQQLLVGAKMSLSMVQVQDASSQEAMCRTDQILAEAVEASRSLAVELSPPILRYGGLAPALGWLGQWMHEKHALKVEVVAEPHVPLPAEDVQVFLFQAVRELLFNVVKHAKVDWAKVELKQEPGRVLRLSVSDEGAGFVAGGLLATACAPGGFGLFSIRERLSVLEGHVEIQSSPGAGTCISLLVPLPPETLTNASAGAAAGRPATASVENVGGGAGLPNASGAKIRVLIADDHAVVRDGLSRLLQMLPDMEVVGKATDGREVVELALQLRPDVVIMDVSMPERSGIEATRCILADLPGTRIIGLSMHKDQDVADQMRQAGAVAYLAKTGPTDGLVAAIRQHAAKVAPGR